MLSNQLIFAMSSQGGQGNPFMSFVPLILIMFIFYFLILRPQQRKQKLHAAMLDSLSKGDRVLTNGGLYMTVRDVKDNIIVATLAEGVKVELSKGAVSAKVQAKGS